MSAATWPDHHAGIDWAGLVEELTDDAAIVKLARDLNIGARWLPFGRAPHWRLIRHAGDGREPLIESRRIREWLADQGLVTWLRGSEVAWLHAPNGAPLAGQPDAERGAA